MGVAGGPVVGVAVGAAGGAVVGVAVGVGWGVVGAEVGVVGTAARVAMGREGSNGVAVAVVDTSTGGLAGVD